MQLPAAPQNRDFLNRVGERVADFNKGGAPPPPVLLVSIEPSGEGFSGTLSLFQHDQTSGAPRIRATEEAAERRVTA